MTGPSPLADLRLLPRRRAAALGVGSVVRAVGLVLAAAGLAAGVAAVGRGRLDHGAVVMLLTGALLRAAAGAATAWTASGAAADVKDGLRRRLLSALVGRGGTRAGSQTLLATDGLDALDDHVGTTLPALIEAAVVPALVGVVLLVADPPSALVIAGTVWLVPVFMVLIGRHTEDRVARSADALARLADHLVDLASGLPVLVGLGRLEAQTASLVAASAEHARRSMRVLRTAFLSSLALELIGTIAVAIVAVVVGLRLLVGDLSLTTGLFVLLLAPECFTPIREVGAAFHAAADGREAVRRADAASAPPATRPVCARRATGIAVHDLTVRHGDRPVVRSLRLRVSRGEVVLLAGASGAGKTTVLDVLAGRGAALEPAAVDGVAAAPAAIAVLPQRPAFATPTAGQELLAFGAAPARVPSLLAAAGLAGLDPAARTALLSPGEARRLAFARVLARVDAGAVAVLLDEPTAHLDPIAAATVLAAIEGLRTRAAILVASHDPAVAALADRVVTLDGTAQASGPAPVRSAVDAAAVPRVATPTTTAPVRLRALLGVLLPLAPRIAAAVVVAGAASGFAVALLVLSGWLVVRASQEPSIALVTVAMVGVRFFGIGRAALRYADRLVTHATAFAGATVLRTRLWRGLASAGPASRTLLAPGATVQALVADTARLRDLLPRTIVPLLAQTLVLGGAVTGALIGVGRNGLPVVALAVMGGTVLPLAAGFAVDRASRRAETTRADALARTAALLAAADDVAANGMTEPLVEDAARVAHDADVADARVRRFVGGLRAVVPLLTGATATAVIIGDGRLGAPQLGALALLAVALGPVLDEIVLAAARLTRGRPVAERLAPLLAASPEAPQGATLQRVDELRLTELAVRFPGSPRPVFSGVSAAVGRGGRLTVTGPSGSGKSTLLAALLRYLPPAAGRIDLDGRPLTAFAAGAVRARIAWAPQEAHVFDSTLRGNLLLARPDRPGDEVLTAALRRAGLGTLLAHAPLGLDTPVGPRGSLLSGGERQRLAVARALLVGADVVLLDEPTAHLDRPTADALIADVDRALADRIRVLVTHDPHVVGSDDVHVDLGRRTPSADPHIAVGGQFYR